MNKRRLAGIALSLTGLGVLATAPAASATQGGHEPVLVCHNRAHHPVLITVDKSSTKYQGHLMHREQEQNLDLVEGIDGDAEAIKAGCYAEETIPGPTVTVTGPTVTETVPGPTVTETGPVVTVTATDTVTIPGPTVTGPATEVPGPTTTGPAVTKPGPTKTGAAVVIPGPTVTGEPTKASDPLITGPKGSLAFTGPNVGVGALGLLLLGAGVWVTAMGRRIRVIRPTA